MYDFSEIDIRALAPLDVCAYKLDMVGAVPKRSRETMANIERGAVVFVNANKDGNDGHYGLHTVLRVDGDDVALARGEYESTPDATDVDVWINKRRLTVLD